MTNEERERLREEVAGGFVRASTIHTHIDAALRRAVAAHRGCQRDEVAADARLAADLTDYLRRLVIRNDWGAADHGRL